MKKFFSEFKSFISKGNILDLAIAVVVGGAFGKIVTSLVGDIIMPIIGLITGGVSVQDLKWVIKPAVYENGLLVTAENALRYGVLIQTIVDFLIISLFIFLAFKIITTSAKKLEKLKQIAHKEKIAETEKEQEVEVLTDSQKQEVLLTEIRDLLKEQVVKDKNNK